MVEIVVLALIGAVIFLWKRLDEVRREVADLRANLHAGDHPGRVAPVVVPSAPRNDAVPSTRASVPLVAPAPASLSVEPVSGSDAPSDDEARASRFRMPGFDFEDLFGRLLPIWAGGVTLAAAGFFLVRWSIDAGLLTPAVRVLLAGLFGIALLAGGEVAYRWRERVADPRVAQALAGAGLATLYAAFYLAGTAYGLIGPVVAFVGLAAVTAAAIGLSFRFGLPSAVLGLVGGFGAPALVGSDDANLPLLTLYLALVTAGLTFTGRRQNRGWMAIAALAGGLGWGALLVVNGVTDTPNVAVLGLYLVLLGAVVPALSGETGRVHWIVRTGAAALAALQLAALVQQGGFGSLEWGFYLLLGAALAWFGWREPSMREGNAVAAAVGLALLAFWPDAATREFALVAAGLATIFAGMPLAQLRRSHGRAIDIGQSTGMALGLAGLVHLRFLDALYAAPALGVAAALASLATIAAGAALLADRAEGADRRWAWLAQGAAALMAYDAIGQVAPESALAWLSAIAAAGLAWRAPKTVGALAVLLAILAAWALGPVGTWSEAGLYGLGGEPVAAGALPSLRAVGLYFLPVVLVATAWRWASSHRDDVRRVLEAVAIAGAVVAAHILYRSLFAELVGTDFVATGVMQRAVWEVLLLGAAWVVHARGWPRAALAVLGAVLAHYGWFSLVLHNPLWAEQAVGPLPLANALLAAHGVALAGLVLLRRWLPAEPRWLRWAVDGATMVVIAVLALSELRQMFAGPVLPTVHIGATEDLLRSLTGIVLAVGFLLWGSRGGGRSWRIGSLVVMLVAVLKVFLVDAAGLEGLARVASFMALGFSLIGIGWFYNRQLRAPARESNTA